MKLLLLLPLVVNVWGVILPGTAKEYSDGDIISVDVNVLQSVNTHLPYMYYDLPFCKPNYTLKKEDSENLGEILLGDRILKSPYDQIKMGINFHCKILCAPIRMDERRTRDFDEKIRDDYTVSLIMDGLPVSVHNGESNTVSLGVPIGLVEKDQNGKEQFVLYNHLEFHVKYQTGASVLGAALGVVSPQVKRITAFHAKPFSYKHPVVNGQLAQGSCSENFDPSKGQVQLTSDEHIVFSYAVIFSETQDSWITRWDPYFIGSDSEIHWFAIVNSLLIVLFLTGMVAVIIVKTLRKDFDKYNLAQEREHDIQEETGWKLVHGDVFRTPEYPMMLAVFTGTGVQLLGMAMAVLISACLGFLSPQNRGSIFTMMLLCFAFLGAYGGHTAARLYKLWKLFSWKVVFMVANFVPAQLFGLFFFINLFVWGESSSAAVPIGSMLVVIGVCVVINTPLAVVGAVIGYRKDPITIPVKINNTVRPIPQQAWYLHPACTILMGGVLPFGAVFIEVFFILTSLWMNKYYYVFGFLFLVFIILIATCAEITVVMIYFQLCSENHKWWWRSYLTSGSSGLYLFIYSIFYFFYFIIKNEKVGISHDLLRIHGDGFLYFFHPHWDNWILGFFRIHQEDLWSNQGGITFRC